MEKKSKIEQQLSEEQLQEITGGCVACEADWISASFALQESEAYLRAAKAAKKVAESSTIADMQLYHTTVAQRHEDQAARLHSQAQSFYQSFKGRGQH